MHINPLKPTIPREKDTQLTWEGLSGAASTLSIANLALAQEKPLLVITPDVQTAEKYHHELQFFTQGSALPIYHFPDRETLPYDHFSPHEDLTSERLLTLHRLPHLKHGIVIASITTLMHQLPPTDFLQAHSFLWSIGDMLDLTRMQSELAQAGYRHAEQVIQHGEFAVRGAIVDVFPMGSELPFRIELFDDEIESIRTFDPETQLSIEKIHASQLLPTHEYPLTEESIVRFRKNWRAQFSGNPAESPIYQHITNAQPIGGIEYYLSLFFEKTGTFFDYCPTDSQIIFVGHAPNAARQFWDEVQTRYEQLSVDKKNPICAPNQIFSPVNTFFTSAKPFLQIRIPTLEKIELPDLRVNHRKKNPMENLNSFIQSDPGRILICAESTGRREVLLELLHKDNLVVTLVDDWQSFLNQSCEVALTIAPLDTPLWLKSDRLVLITEAQLFGQQVMQTRRQKKRTVDPNSMIRSLAELQTGSLIVHLDHGIGQYVGLERITTDEIESEYLTLTYSGGDRIYVPIGSLHLISRYTGADSEHVTLNKLGSNQWEKSKQKAAKKIRDVAAELLKIYSEREAQKGFAFPKPDNEHTAFREAFLFEETPDQRQSIDTVIADMTSERTMDRLVCGDVGFGKTEVAMQAAFLAVQGGKQAAVLVPTILLANQHFQNFQDRFADWPIKLGVLSRLQSPKSQKETIAQLKSGTLDIIISTHKLLNKQIKFHDLGLLIIDEEHRFGVRQKERIKSLRSQVDILTLTATPIPRTLNMSMAGIRDLSIIATPPAKRLSIKTFVHEYDKALVREAILRETMRGGQVYFLHNKVETIARITQELQEAIPEVTFTFAHGQMPEKQLEKTMADFYHQRFHVLVCTTIIESGIDIPSANTIVINNANQFGLAQLHQIRGRVGRSHHQAYAYLLIRNKKALTSDARKRLDAIAELEDLGVGFQLATHDLEIRGAGELLGESQSGHIQAIGFTLYMELLDEAVKALKSGKEIPNTLTHDIGPEIDLHISALFPENYMPDVHTRLTIYKRLSACENADTIQTLKSEIIDRFGLLPDNAQRLFELAHLKIKAKKFGIKKIEVNKQFGTIHFNEKPNVDSKRLIQLIQNQHNIYQLAGADRLRFKLPSETPEERFKVVETVLAKLH